MFPVVDKGGTGAYLVAYPGHKPGRLIGQEKESHLTTTPTEVVAEVTPFDAARYYNEEFSYADARKEAIGKGEFFFIRRVRITPADAEEILENWRLERERKLNPKSWQKIARSMVRFRFFGLLHTLKFGMDGMLYDGQHRLNSCRVTGIDFVTSVLFNIPFDAHGHIDTMRPRSVATELTFRGFNGSALLGRVASQAYAWVNGDHTRGPHTVPPVEEIITLLGDDDTIARALEVAQVFRSDKLATEHALAFAFWVIMHDSRLPTEGNLRGTTVAGFFEALHRGAGLEEDDPVWKLRERLRDEFYERDINKTFNQEWLIIQAWNHFRNNKRVPRYFRVPVNKVSLPTPL